MTFPSASSAPPRKRSESPPPAPPPLPTNHSLSLSALGLRAELAPSRSTPENVTTTESDAAVADSSAAPPAPTSTSVLSTPTAADAGPASSSSSQPRLPQRQRLEGSRRTSEALASTDWVASSLTRRFGIAGGLAWLGILTFGVVGEQVGWGSQGDGCGASFAFTLAGVTHRQAGRQAVVVVVCLCGGQVWLGRSRLPRCHPATFTTFTTSLPPCLDPFTTPSHQGGDLSPPPPQHAQAPTDPTPTPRPLPVRLSQVKTRLEVAAEASNTREVQGEVEVALPSGLRYTDLRLGGGAAPQPGDLVVLQYKASADGGWVGGGGVGGGHLVDLASTGLTERCLSCNPKP